MDNQLSPPHHLNTLYFLSSAAVRDIGMRKQQQRNCWLAPFFERIAHIFSDHESKESSSHVDISKRYTSRGPILVQTVWNYINLLQTIKTK